MGLCQQYAAIWPADQQDISQAVCMAESGGIPSRHCDSCVPGVTEDSRGLWQVNVAPNANPQFASWDLFDPATNARAALQIWQSQGWRAWSTFKAGTYEQFLTGSPVSSQDVLAGAPEAAQPPSTPNLLPWLIGGAAAILVLFGRR